MGVTLTRENRKLEGEDNDFVLDVLILSGLWGFHAKTSRVENGNMGLMLERESWTRSRVRASGR